MFPCIRRFKAFLLACNLASELDEEQIMLEGDSLEACNWILLREMEPSGLSSNDVTTLRKIMDDHPRWSLTWATSHTTHGVLNITDLPQRFPLVTCLTHLEDPTPLSYFAKKKKTRKSTYFIDLLSLYSSQQHTKHWFF